MKLKLVLTEEEKSQTGSLLAMELAELFDDCFQLVMLKNTDYGDAWRRQGWMGNLARLMSKTSRMQNMLWRDDYLDSTNEPVSETAKDLINIAAFFVLNHKHQNRWGVGDLG